MQQRAHHPVDCCASSPAAVQPADLYCTCSEPKRAHSLSAQASSPQLRRVALFTSLLFDCFSSPALRIRLTPPLYSFFPLAPPMRLPDLWILLWMRCLFIQLHALFSPCGFCVDERRLPRSPSLSSLLESIHTPLASSNPLCLVRASSCAAASAVDWRSRSRMAWAARSRRRCRLGPWRPWS